MKLKTTILSLERVKDVKKNGGWGDISIIASEKMLDRRDAQFGIT